MNYRKRKTFTNYKKEYCNKFSDFDQNNLF